MMMILSWFYNKFNNNNNNNRCRLLHVRTAGMKNDMEYDTARSSFLLDNLPEPTSSSKSTDPMVETAATTTIHQQQQQQQLFCHQRKRQPLDDCELTPRTSNTAKAKRLLALRNRKSKTEETDDLPSRLRGLLYCFAPKDCHQHRGNRPSKQVSARVSLQRRQHQRSPARPDLRQPDILNEALCFKRAPVTNFNNGVDGGSHESQLEYLQAALRESEARRMSAESQVERLQSALVESQAKVNELTKALDDRDAEIESLNAALEEATAALEHAKQNNLGSFLGRFAKAVRNEFADDLPSFSFA